jgi:acetyl esterase/lipase
MEKTGHRVYAKMEIKSHKQNTTTMRIVLLSVLTFVLGYAASAQEYQYETRENIHYYSDAVNKSDPYINEHCVLDIYYPVNAEGFATVVWFHGGGLTGGHKEIPWALKEKGICVVGVNYRLYPNVKAPVYIEDAAAAVSWVFNNISAFGGDSSLVFVSGHSAGGYLTSMVGLDKSWLHQFGIDADRIAGLIPFSGHTITHFTIREERGIPGTRPVVDSLAPLFHVRPDAPPLLLITGDRELEMLGRYEENAYLERMMKIAGHKETTLYELQGYGHNMVSPAFPLLLKEVRRITEEKQQ